MVAIEKVNKKKIITKYSSKRRPHPAGVAIEELVTKK